MANVNLTDYGSGGMNARVYVPENVNENTEVFVFVHGGSEMNNENRYNDWNSVINNQLGKDGSNSIVVMPTMANRWDENWASNTMDIVENIQNDYGIQNNNVTSCGFSFGGWGAARTTIENIQRNPDLEPQVLFLLDDYGRSTQNTSKYILGDGGQEALLQNDSVIFSYVSKNAAYSGQITDKSRQLDTLAESNVNLVRVVCDDGAHSAIKNDFFKNNMIDFTNGSINLAEDGYTYQKANVTVDPETGEKMVTWENVDVNDINTKEKLYNYFDIDSSKVNLNTLPLSNTGAVAERNTFVDLASLQQWSSQINAINEESISHLSTMIAAIEGLEDSWVGNFATGFINDSSDLVKSAQKVHNDMKDVGSLLIEVMNVESNL